MNILWLFPMGKTSYTDRPAKLIREMRKLGHNLYQLSDKEIDYNNFFKNIFLNLIPKTQFLKEMPVKYPSLIYEKYTRNIDNILKKIHFPSLPNINTLYPHSIMNMFLLRKYLRSFVKRNKIDVVIFFIPQSGIIAVSLQKLNIPLIFDHEDQYVDFTWDKNYKPTIAEYERYSLENSNLVVGVGNELYNKKLFNKTKHIRKLISIQHGYDEGIFDPNILQEDKKTELKRELGIEENRKIIVYIGRIDEYVYRIDLLPKIAEYFKKAEEKPLFFVVGEGRYLQRLKNEIVDLELMDCFKLIEHFVPQTDVSKYIAISDIFILLTVESLYGTPSKVFEILAMNKPLIMTDLPDSHLYIKNGVNGFLLQNDPQIIADKIMILLKNKMEINNDFIKKFTWQIRAEKYIEEIKQLIETKNTD